ncbi:MAG: hypothetical protein ACM3U2_06890, partial [Deltaproteobacteria bacterium]
MVAIPIHPSFLSPKENYKEKTTENSGQKNTNAVDLQLRSRAREFFCPLIFLSFFRVFRTTNRLFLRAPRRLSIWIDTEKRTADDADTRGCARSPRLSLSARIRVI